MVIYKTTNLLDGKFYIGQTIQQGKNFKKYLGSGIRIKRAIKLYGRNNFKKEILCECDNQEQLDRMERFFIYYLKPHYNIALGGNGAGKHSEATKLKMKLSNKGKTPVNPSSETRLKRSISCKNKQKMLCIETDIVYNSRKDLSRKLNIPLDTIKKIASGKQKSTRGFHFKDIN